MPANVSPIGQPLQPWQLGLLALIIRDAVARFPTDRGITWEAFLIAKINYQSAACRLPPMLMLEAEIEMLVNYYTTGQPAGT